MTAGINTASPAARAPYRPSLGAHIYVERGLYSHHGIDCGDWTVIDFSGQNEGKHNAMIRRVSLAEFAQGCPIWTRPYGARFAPEVVVERATAMIGRSGYHLFANNCEHFATWCVAGERASHQVEAAFSAAGIFGLVQFAPALGPSAVGALGQTAPGSAANVTSGLKEIGGSAAGGVAVVAGAAAVVGAGTTMYVLRDKPYLTDQERAARRVGRAAGVGGAALGVGLAVHTVGALGVAGYGAVGLSSGLATLGRVAGGGMVAGVAVVVATPLLAAFVFALLDYALKRHLDTSSPSSSRCLLGEAELSL
jgi:hypothetical protein